MPLFISYDDEQNATDKLSELDFVFLRWPVNYLESSVQIILLRRVWNRFGIANRVH